MQNQISPREQAIISLDFTAKLKIAWKLTITRGLVYFAVFAGIILAIVALQAIIHTARLNPLWQLVPMLLYGFLFMTCLGVVKNVLMYMDGKKAPFGLPALLEPFARPAVFPLVLLLTICYMPCNFYLLAPLSGLSIFALTLVSIIPLLLLEYHYYYASEHGNASAAEILTRPFRLIRRCPKIWLSGCAGYAIATLVVWFTSFPAGIIVAIVDILSDPNVLYNYYLAQNSGNILDLLQTAVTPLQLGVRVLYIVLLYLMSAAGMVFSTFMFAVAYKQSMLVVRHAEFKSGE